MEGTVDGSVDRSVETARLLLRRPLPDDAAALRRVDPGARLEEELEHWRARGFGRWTARLLPGAVPGLPGLRGVVGVGGLRAEAWDGEPVLDLSVHLAPEARGQGLATELARAAVAEAARVRPGVPVQARVPALDVPARRTALAAGLRRRPDLDRTVDGHHEVFFRSS